MPAIAANGLTIAYEDEGPREGVPLLLIMGLGMQLVAWPSALVDRLVARGFRVIRFDNRDTGLSSRISAPRHPPVMAQLAAAWLGLPVRAPYALGDMARDSVGLLDALGVERAHIVGASMGGMIAQIIACEHPQSLLSLVSLMSTTGARRLPGPTPQVSRGLLRRRSRRSREESIQGSMAFLRLIGSPGFPMSADELRALVETSIDRAYYPPGFYRQLQAVVSAPSREKRLRDVVAPTLVLHGADDPMIPPEGGRATARAIPGAKLVIIPGMGHDLAPALAPRLAEEIAAHCLANGPPAL